MFFFQSNRGEKLYVTKDKRLKSNWRKKLCWAVGLGLLALALLVGILAACKYHYFCFCLSWAEINNTNDGQHFFFPAGVIGSKEEPIDSTLYNDNDVKAAGVFGVGSRNNQSDYPPSPEPPRSTVPANPPTTEENVIYRRFPNGIWKE